MQSETNPETRDTTDIRKRRRPRWRWLLVAAMLCAVGVLLVVDRRDRPSELIGRWQHLKNPGYRKAPLPDIRLHADGSGEFLFAKGVSNPMTWWTDGPLVVMQHDARSPAEWLQFQLSETLAHVRNTGWRRPQLRLYVTSLGQGRIVFSRIEPTERTRDSSDVEELLSRVEE